MELNKLFYILLGKLQQKDFNACDFIIEKHNFENIDYTPTEQGPTLLLHMVHDKNIKSVDYLLAKGANMHRIVEKLLTPFIYSISNSTSDIVDLFYKNGASLETKAKTGENLIEIATEFGNKDVLEYLIANKC